MITSYITPSLLICGDIHGKFRSTVVDSLEKTIKRLQIEDCIIFCVGDCGIGFCDTIKKEYNQISDLNNFFKRRNITFLSIRGNHDNPFFWDIAPVDLSHFKLIPDYTVLNINGERFLCVGGAISIDRSNRIDGKSYWKNEIFNLDRSKIVECDVIITHSAPPWIGPNDKSGISYWCETDKELWADCKKERKEHGELYKLSKCKKSYSGHFHQYISFDHDECYATILDELQLIQHRNESSL